jgi:hypothetical protein
MADSIINISIGLHELPASVAERCLRGDGSHFTSGAVKPLAEELIAIASGVRVGKVIARVDSCTRGAASQTIAMTQASCTAGDKIHIHLPGRGRHTLTAVSGTPVAASGEYAIITSDTATGDSVEAAILAMPGLQHYVTADNASGTVTVTALEPGTWAHGILLEKVVTTGAAVTLGGATLSGGDDILDQPSLAIVFGSANITAGDTISLGAIEYTWAASASTDNEITLSTTEATAAANFATKINADARWTGLVSAAVETATVTLTWLGDPRAGQHALVTTIAETNAGAVAPGGTVLVTGTEVGSVGTTLTGSSTCRTFGGKGAA